MERIVYEVKFQRGKVLLEDENNFWYASNGQEQIDDGALGAVVMSQSQHGNQHDVWQIILN